MTAKRNREAELVAAVRMAEIGDFRAAEKAFTALLASDKRNAGLTYNLGLVKENLGDVEAAAALQSRALALDGKFALAARRLSRLLAGFELARSPTLNFEGLSAALSHGDVNLQPIAMAVLSRALLVDGPLKPVVEAFDNGQAAGAAAATIRDHTHAGWRSPAVLKALTVGVVRDPVIERFLTAVRRALLLEIAPARLEDRALSSFALALAAAARNGDFAWAETEAETAALNGIQLDRSKLGAGDIAAAGDLLRLMLYRPVETLLPEETWSELPKRIRPRSIGETVQGLLAVSTEERALARALPRLAPLKDPTTRRVAEQYEGNPYPRWSTATLRGPDQLRPTLGRYFTPEELGFLNRPFDVLIAGAGTGQQVVQSAHLYGPSARVLAIDISAASLAYAKRMAARLGVRNVEFMLADILDLDRLDRTFMIIECIGVLHHMADPWQGWRTLLRRLAPGGLSFIGLYSAISRANLRKLRADPDYPGPGCSDAAARAFRAKVLARPASSLGSELTRSHNFYNLNEFRDLALHVNEHQCELPEIERFLVDNGLRFAGFHLPEEVLLRFRKFSGLAAGPGSLAEWHRFELDNPQTFDAMYCFWTRKLS